MKRKIKNALVTSALVIGLAAGTAIAQTGTDSTTQPKQPTSGTMMGSGMMGSGMMGMNRGGMGMMGGQSGQDGWDMGCNGMMGGSMMNRMQPEQQQQFLNETKELRQKMSKLRFDYMEAMRDPKATPQDLAKIEKEMLQVRGQMMDKMNSSH